MKAVYNTTRITLLVPIYIGSVIRIQTSVPSGKMDANQNDINMIWLLSTWSSIKTFHCIDIIWVLQFWFLNT